MPPKKTTNATVEGVDGTAAGAVTALVSHPNVYLLLKTLENNISTQFSATSMRVGRACNLIMSCDEFKADNAKLAPIFGLAQGKNVPRKINSIVNPYGFEFKGGKIVTHDGAAAASSNTSATEVGKDGKTTKGSSTSKSNTAKKRKLAVSFPDEDDSDHVKGEDDQEV
ncbi:hypothetical protein UCDDA912_g02308 [Diaporthe ampelina]|uniref:Uncharacterized protein n=1 Tax=Diaporthe ampelina TaxID=1214573 RepID=A0A0G2FUK8_9PEZI|nr:hypothetical protein UCDDA912_g02308 [Diaporthe ampelina]